MQKIILSLILLSLGSLVTAGTNTVSKIRNGQVISIQDDEETIHVKSSNGKEYKINIRDIVDHDSSKKIQGGQMIHFYIEISQQR